MKTHIPKNERKKKLNPNRIKGNKDDFIVFPVYPVNCLLFGSNRNKHRILQNGVSFCVVVSFLLRFSSIFFFFARARIQFAQQTI